MSVSKYHKSLQPGAEILLFDPKRKPSSWTDVLRPGDCAVFLKDATTSDPVRIDGRAFHKAEEITCLVFDRIEQARQFCQSAVLQRPHLRCEIYNSQGLAHPPLLRIVHPDWQKKEDAGSVWSRRRKQFALCAVLLSLPLFWLGSSGSVGADIAILFAINSIVLALRFLYWDFGLKHREGKRLDRLEAHLRLENDDA